MKITIKLSETNNALLNRVVKEEKVDASEFANNAFLDKFLPVSEKLGIEAGFILQEHEAGTLNAWLVKQSRCLKPTWPEKSHSSNRPELTTFICTRIMCRMGSERKC